MKLYLIRHGQTPGNVRGALDTALPGPSLTDLGHQQAAALAERLSGEPIVAVYASQAIRARQTAAPVAEKHGLEVQVIEGVKEIDAGELEGRTDRDAVIAYMEALRKWTMGELGFSVPGGETGEQVRSRMSDAVEQLRAKHEQTDPDGVVVLVSHGGAMRLGAEWLAGNVRPEVANAGIIPNTGIIVLDAVPGGWHCVTWADAEL